MSRIATRTVEADTGATGEFSTQIKQSAGKVPNTYAAIGAHGPAALRAMLRADAVLAAGSLSRQDQETIKLAVSAAVGCDYCEAAHSLLAKLAGLEPDVLKKIRAGEPTGDAKRDALVRFVRLLVLTHGTISEAEFSAIKAAGYREAQLVDISLALTVISHGRKAAGRLIPAIRHERDEADGRDEGRARAENPENVRPPVPEAEEQERAERPLNVPDRDRYGMRNSAGPIRASRSQLGRTYGPPAMRYRQDGMWTAPPGPRLS
jgi:AhpD family alkylhydroperoxidase